MKINIKDIPSFGKDVHFDLEVTSLNQRLASGNSKISSVVPYVFLNPVLVSLHLNVEGSTVFINGTAEGVFQTLCSRCCEETQQEIKVSINMVLKPLGIRGVNPALDEDVNYGFYDGKEVDCSSFVDEHFILALPYVVLCQEGCKGLCPKCGMNLNVAKCECEESSKGDEGFSVLKGLKLLQ